MGTSADRTPGSGGAWTPLKYATTSYVRGLRSGDPRQHDRALRVLARHVPVLGGAGAASGSARAGRSGMQRLGGLLAGIGAAGLAPTLEAFGLTDLVGRDRFDVLDALVTLLAGDGDDLDSQAARDAACDVLDEVFADADTWQELAAATVTREDMQTLLEVFLACYVYNRTPVIAERLDAWPTSKRPGRQTPTCASSSATWFHFGYPMTHSQSIGLGRKAGRSPTTPSGPSTTLWKHSTGPGYDPLRTAHRPEQRPPTIRGHPDSGLGAGRSCSHHSDR